MNALVNTLPMLRLLARLERLTLLVGGLSIVTLAAVGTSSMQALYPSLEDRVSYEAVTLSTTAAHALNGPPVGLSELGGIVVFELGWYLALGLAALSIVLVARNLRGAEERGRLELLRSGPLGVHANLVATLLLAAVMNVAIGAGVAAALVVFGASVAGSVMFGASLVAIGVTFAAVTAVAAQLTEHGRATYGMALGTLGVAFAVRAAGDASALGELSWASPLGWAQATHPFAENRWWPLLVSTAAAVLLVGAAVFLERRRDLGAGLIRPGPGPAAAADNLITPFGLARRLHRGAASGWVVAAFGLGVAFGAVGADAGEVADTSEAVSDLVAGFGDGSMEDAFFALVAVMLAILAGASAVATMRRALTEEDAGRADVVLAGPVSRRHWLGSHVVAGAVVSATVLLAGGVGAGLAHGLRTGEMAALGRLGAAVAAQLPAVWLLLAVALALIGLAPRVSAVVWLAVAWSAVASILGEALNLPRALLGLSPFEHTPRLPAEQLGGVVGAGPQASLVGLSVLALLAAGLVVVGFEAFTRRNLT